MSAGRRLPTNVSAATHKREVLGDARLVTGPWSASADTVWQAHTRTHAGVQSAALCASSQSTEAVTGAAITTAASANVTAFANQFMQLLSIADGTCAVKLVIVRLLSCVVVGCRAASEAQPFAVAEAPTCPGTAVASAA